MLCWISNIRQGASVLSWMHNQTVQPVHTGLIATWNVKFIPNSMMDLRHHRLLQIELCGVSHTHTHTLPALCHATPECCRLSVTRRTRGSVGWPRHGSCSCGPLWSPRQTWGHKHTHTPTQHFTCYTDVVGQEKYSQYSLLNFFHVEFELLNLQTSAAVIFWALGPSSTSTVTHRHWYILCCWSMDLMRSRHFDKSESSQAYWGRFCCYWLTSVFYSVETMSTVEPVSIPLPLWREDQSIHLEQQFLNHTQMQKRLVR